METLSSCKCEVFPLYTSPLGAGGGGQNSYHRTPVYQYLFASEDILNVVLDHDVGVIHLDGVIQVLCDDLRMSKTTRLHRFNRQGQINILVVPRLCFSMQ